ncbi:MAG: iron-containing alcohol dehydrogenase [Synergistaceae bacterium]
MDFVPEMNPFRFRMPHEIVFAAGCVMQAADKAASLGSKRPLFITGSSMAKNVILEKLMTSMKSAGMEPGHWGLVKPEPPVSLLDEGVRFIIDGGYDCIIAFGGGSSMDFAKMAAVMAKNPSLRVADVTGNEKVPARGLPTIMIPTTAGSGSEVSAVAVFSFEEEHVKKGVSSGHLVADIALVDPELTIDLPPGITAASGMDALVHGVESYLSLGTNALTQDLALAAIRYISQNLETCVKDGSNREARSWQMYGSMLAGMAFSMSGTAGVHAMSYPLGGEYHVPHGEANTALLRWVMEYNLEGCEEKFVPVAKAMGVFTEGMTDAAAAEAALAAMIDLGERVGVKTRLRDFGIPKEAAATMAPAAMRETRLITNNPRKLDEESVRKIYERAW